MLDQFTSGDAAQARTSAPRLVRRIKWRYAAPIIFVHLVALAAFAPWFFSWTGVVVMGLGLYVFGTLGINLGYHRLLTHRSFSCPGWLERTFRLSHPALADRITFANDYHPWADGKPLVYGDRIKAP